MKARHDRGQASIELLAGVPLLVLGAMVTIQFALAAYTLHLTDGAAEAGALAVAGGTDPEEAVRAALPGWAEDRVDIDAADGLVRVSVQPPAPLPAVAEALEMDSEAWARP